MHWLARLVSKKKEDFVLERKVRGGYPFQMFNGQIVKNGQAYYLEPDANATFNIENGKNFCHLKKYLEGELLPSVKLTNEFVLQGLIYDAKAKTSNTHSSVFLRMVSKKGGPFIVHLDCNEPRAQYSGGAWHLQNKGWSFDLIN